jgi:hypothetical protein
MDRWRLRPSHPQHAPANLYVSPKRQSEHGDCLQRDLQNAIAELQTSVSVPLRLMSGSPAANATRRSVSIGFQIRAHSL